MFARMPQVGGASLAPIPASMLPSSMEVRAPVADSEYGDEWEEPVMVANVRFMRSTELSVTSNGGVTSGYVFKDGSRGLVLADAATSAGAFEVPEGSEVRVDGGERMEAVKVTRHDNLDGTVHHWEIEVR